MLFSIVILMFVGLIPLQSRAYLAGTNNALARVVLTAMKTISNARECLNTTSGNNTANLPAEMELNKLTQQVSVNCSSDGTNNDSKSIELPVPLQLGILEINTQGNNTLYFNNSGINSEIANVLFDSNKNFTTVELILSDQLTKLEIEYEIVACLPGFYTFPICSKFCQYDNSSNKTCNNEGEQICIKDHYPQLWVSCDNITACSLKCSHHLCNQCGVCSHGYDKGYDGNCIATASDSNSVSMGIKNVTNNESYTSSDTPSQWKWRNESIALQIGIATACFCAFVFLCTSVTLFYLLRQKKRELSKLRTEMIEVTNSALKNKYIMSHQLQRSRGQQPNLQNMTSQATRPIIPPFRQGGVSLL